MSVLIEPWESRFTSRAELLTTFDGDAEFVRELVLSFLDRVPVLMGAIESGLSAGDRTAVSHAAHALKGVLGYFDHGSNLASAQRIEKTASGDLAEVPEMLVRLHEGLGDLTCYLAEQFSAGEATGLRTH